MKKYLFLQLKKVLTTKSGSMNKLWCILITIFSLLEIQGQSQSLDFIMDMIHNNPGEKPFETKYSNPKYLKSQGYNAMVTHWHVNCAITYDNFKKNVVPKGTDEREWIENKAKWIDQKLDSCEKYGIDVYAFTDFLVFPGYIWKKYGNEIRGEGSKHSTLGGSEAQKKKPDMQSELLQKLVKKQIEGIFNRFPEIDGLTIRFGETYLHDTPFHAGGSPIRHGKDGIKDHVTLINILKEEICVKRDKILFYRTWDFGYNFHNNPEYYLKVTDQIEPHPNLIFSMKYQQDDFHRMTPFNPSLGQGKHRQNVETQSRMEAYGKGAHPYYTSPGLINGWPETKYEIKLHGHKFTGKLSGPETPRGLKDIIDNGLLCSMMTWSHGGGWDGPYIKHEIWTDLNTYVSSRWAQNMSRSEEEIFYEFANNLGLNGYQADLFRQLCILSIEGVRKGHMTSYAGNDIWWTRDQYFSASSNNGTVKEILKNDLIDEVLAEKAEASAIWRQIEAISRQIQVTDAETQEAIEVSCTYGRIKYELIEQMWIMMIYDHDLSSEGNKKAIKDAIQRYDELWQEWNELEKSSSLCATLYTDKAFRNRREGSIGELVDKLREQIK